MISALIVLLVVILVVAVIASVLIYCIQLLPIEAQFANLIRVLIIAIAVLIIILKALPLLGVAL